MQCLCDPDLSARKIEGCARDDDTEKGILKKLESRDEWLVTGMPAFGHRHYVYSAAHFVILSGVKCRMFENVKAEQ